MSMKEMFNLKCVEKEAQSGWIKLVLCQMVKKPVNRNAGEV